MNFWSTYLKIFDTNILDTELKPDNFDTLTSDIDLNLENEGVVHEIDSVILPARM